MVKGSCFCGGVAFEVEKITFVRHCHRSRCRKESEAAFGTAAVAQPDHYRFVKGEESVRFYDYLPNGRRAFCGVYGGKAPLDSDLGQPHYPDPGRSPRWGPGRSTDPSHVRRVEGPLVRDQRQFAQVRQMGARLRAAFDSYCRLGAGEVL